MTELEIKKEANAAARMYLLEHFKEIDNERTKSSYLLAFEALVFTELLKWLQPASTGLKYSFVIFASLSLIAALINLFYPKAASLYGDYAGVYDAKIEPEHFLNTEFQSLQEQKSNAQRMGNWTRHWNQIASLLLFVSLIFPTIYFFQ